MGCIHLPDLPDLNGIYASGRVTFFGHTRDRASEAMRPLRAEMIASGSAND
jgi:hypothetical protein